MIPTPRSSTATLVKALAILSRDIQSDDGVANAAILEASERLKELDWTPTKTALPSKSTPFADESLLCLCLHKGTPPPFALELVAPRMGRRRRGRLLCQAEDVSHWMKIPDLPA